MDGKFGRDEQFEKGEKRKDTRKEKEKSQKKKRKTEANGLTF